MLSGIEDVAFAAGIVVGSCLLLTVCWVWIRKQVCGVSGLSMCVVGLALVGLTVWRTITIEATAEGIRAEFRGQVDQLVEMVSAVDSNVQEIVEANIGNSRDIESLANAVRTNGEQFVVLTRALESRNTVPGLGGIREGVTVAPVDTQLLQNRRRLLEAIQVR